MFLSRIDGAGGEEGKSRVHTSRSSLQSTVTFIPPPVLSLALPDSPLPPLLLPQPLCHVCVFLFSCRGQMFKVPVGTLALLAAPTGQRLPCGDERAPAADAPLPPDTPSPTAQARPQMARAASSGATAAVAAPAAGTGDGGGASGAAATSTPTQVEGGSRPKAAQRRASAVTAAPVRQQLELLGDLSQAVGHGEAALVCASLLRDEAGAKTTLR